MTPEEIDDITIRVYRRRLDDECPGDADRQLARIGEKKMHAYARSWRGIVVATLIEAGLHQDGRGLRQSREERDINRVTPRAGSEDEPEPTP